MTIFDCWFAIFIMTIYMGRKKSRFSKLMWQTQIVFIVTLSHLKISSISMNIDNFFKQPIFFQLSNFLILNSMIKIFWLPTFGHHNGWVKFFGHYMEVFWEEPAKFYSSNWRWFDLHHWSNDYKNLDFSHQLLVTIMDDWKILVAKLGERNFGHCPKKFQSLPQKV